MHQQTAQFLEFLDDYDPTDGAAVALEFVAGFIDDENAAEIVAALEGISPNVKAEFLARVAKAPSTETEWEQLRFVGANLNRRDESRARNYWRLCVNRVRQAMTQ